MDHYLAWAQTLDSHAAFQMGSHDTAVCCDCRSDSKLPFTCCKKYIHISLSLQERPEMFWYASWSLLTTLPLWQTTTKMHRKSPFHSKSTKAFGLKIYLKKTEVMYQLPPGSDDIGQDIEIKGPVLTQVNKFKYLDSTVVNNNNRQETELNTQTSNALNAFKSFGGLRSESGPTKTFP